MITWILIVDAYFFIGALVVALGWRDAWERAIDRDGDNDYTRTAFIIASVMVLFTWPIVILGKADND